MRAARVGNYEEAGARLAELNSSGDAAETAGAIAAAYGLYEYVPDKLVPTATTGIAAELLFAVPHSNPVRMRAAANDLRAAIQRGDGVRFGAPDMNVRGVGYARRNTANTAVRFDRVIVDRTGITFEVDHGSSETTPWSEVANIDIAVARQIAATGQLHPPVRYQRRVVEIGTHDGRQLAVDVSPTFPEVRCPTELEAAIMRFAAVGTAHVRQKAADRRLNIRAAVSWLLVVTATVAVFAALAIGIGLAA